MINKLRFLILTTCIAWIYLQPAQGQIGYRDTYGFLNLPTSGRIAALGGNTLAFSDNDINLSLANPSLITPEMHNNLSLSYLDYVGDINAGTIMYSRTFNKAGSFVGGFQFINYGKFDYADETGIRSGTFSANEFALSVGWGRQLNNHFSIGANGKLILSQLESYTSFGIAVDVAGTFFTNEKLFTASLIGRNIGTQIVPYRAGDYEALPFEIQIALAQQFRHVPLRFSLIYTHLETWDLTYTDPTDPANQSDPLTGEIKAKTGLGKFADNLMRHIIFGGEFTIAKVFSIRLGYNYQRRQELKLSDRSGLSGFSYGIGFRVKMFNVSFSHVTYQTGGLNPNYFTIATNLQKFTKKK